MQAAINAFVAVKIGVFLMLFSVVNCCRIFFKVKLNKKSDKFRYDSYCHLPHIVAHNILSEGKPNITNR